MRKRLYERYSTSELRTEIAKTAELILERQQWSWRLGEMVAFVVPAIGFAMALWNLRIEGNTIPYREIGMPLLVSLGEVLLVVLLARGVRSSACVTLREWELFAEEMAVERPRDGLRPTPPQEKGEEEMEWLGSHEPPRLPLPPLPMPEPHDPGLPAATMLDEAADASPSPPTAPKPPKLGQMANEELYY